MGALGLQLQFMPGFSGTPWVIMGTGIADITPDATGRTAIPLSCQFTLDALAANTDIISMFAEYRIAAVKYTFTSQNGSAGQVNVNGLVPEIWASAWPNDAVPPSTIQVQEQRICQRKAVTALDPLVMIIAPRPAIELYQSPILTGFAYASNQDTWISTGSPSLPCYAISAMVRNFSSIGNSGQNVRISAEAFLEFRRLR